MYLINRLRALVRDDSGQDLIEYALLAALIALASVIAVTQAGTAVARCGKRSSACSATFRSVSSRSLACEAGRARLTPASVANGIPNSRS